MDCSKRPVFSKGVRRKTAWPKPRFCPLSAVCRIDRRAVLAGKRQYHTAGSLVGLAGQTGTTDRIHPSDGLAAACQCRANRSGLQRSQTVSLSGGRFPRPFWTAGTARLENHEGADWRLGSDERQICIRNSVSLQIKYAVLFMYSRWRVCFQWYPDFSDRSGIIWMKSHIDIDVLAFIF